MRCERGISNAVVAVVFGVIALFAVIGGAFMLALLSFGNDDGGDPRDVYLSLGDSVAAGNGASNTHTRSFAALLAEREGEVSLHNIAEAGATTQAVLDDQLARGVAVIETGRVRFVTISVGGNDLAALIPNPACVEDPLPASCPLDEALAGVEQRLRAIVGYIRDANADVPIVLLAYPNFFSGTGHPFEAPAGRVLPRLNDVIRKVASSYDRLAVAEPFDKFEGEGDALTGVLDEPFDPHPNDAGHAVIAKAFARALDQID